MKILEWFMKHDIITTILVSAIAAFIVDLLVLTR